MVSNVYVLSPESGLESLVNVRPSSFGKALNAFANHLESRSIKNADVLITKFIKIKHVAVPSGIS